MDTPEPKKGANRIAKEAIVEEIKLNLDNSSSIVLTDYQGLTHKQLEEFKKQLKVANTKFAITKNTLLKISLSSSKNFADKISDEALNAPTATLFITGDPIEALKALQKLSKETGLPKIKVGVVDGSTLDESQIIKLASLPNKQTLLTQLVGTLNSPIQGLVVVLNGNIQKLALVLNAIAQNKPAESTAANVSAEEASAPTPEPTQEPEQTESETPTQEQAAPDQAPSEPTAEEQTENNETVSGGGENS